FVLDGGGASAVSQAAQAAQEVDRKPSAGNANQKNLKKSDKPEKSKSDKSKESRSDAFHLLPAFDEFLIAYANRRPSLEAEWESRVMTKNGIFRPTLMREGAIKGIWKRTLKKDQVLVELEPFQKLSSDEYQASQIACERLGEFLGKKADLNV
ncbi:MAG: winged helix DNA-binding domain-containing protein, partial [Leptospiraceae bacterium]|nr:winged helix DNA-binding domain-containing protein [Leptospiraceae bacterium]